MEKSLEEKIQEFWDWFSRNELKLYNTLMDRTKFGVDMRNPENPPMLEKLSNRMKRVHPEISYEFYLNQDDKYKFDFFISANGVVKFFPVVIQTVELSPKSNQFNFIAFKQAHKNKEELKRMALGHAGKKVLIQDIYFDYQTSAPGDKKPITLYLKGYEGDYFETLEQMFYLLDRVIGEYDVATKLGEIVISPLDNKNTQIPLYELPDVIASLK